MRDGKGKQVVQEYGAHNFRALDDIVKGKCGCPVGGAAHIVIEEAEVEQVPHIPRARQEVRNVELDHNVKLLTRKIGEMELMMARCQSMRPAQFFGIDETT